MKDPKFVQDIDNMMCYMAGQSWLDKKITWFKGKDKDDLFNAYYNQKYTFHCNEDIVKKISDCLDCGVKFFNIKFLKLGNKLYAYKETKTQSVFVEYKLYISK